MIIRRIDLNNFRLVNESIKPPPGGFIISGENGSGKSSWIYGINFAFYGSVPDLNIADLLAWGESNGSVSVWFEIYDGCYRLTREFNAHSTKISLDVYRNGWENFGGTDPTSKLRELFPVPQSVFNEVVIKQQGDFGSLTEATPAGRYEIFKNLSQIEVWEQYGKRVDAKLSSIDEKLERARITKESAERTIEDQELKPMSEEALEQGAEFIEQMEKQLAAVQERIQEQKNLRKFHEVYQSAQEFLRDHQGFQSWFDRWQKVKDFEEPSTPYDETSYQNLQKEFEEANTEEENLHKQEEELQEKYDELLEEVKEKRKELDEITHLVFSLRSERKDVQQEWDGIQQERDLISQGKCPTCQRPFRSVETKTKELETQFVAKDDELKDYDDKIARVEEVIQTTSDDIEKLHEGISRCQSTRPVIQQKIKSIGAKKAEIQSTLDAMSEDREATEQFRLQQKFFAEYPYEKSPDEIYQSIAVANSVKKPEEEPDDEDLSAQEQEVRSKLYAARDALSASRELDKSFRYQHGMIKESMKTIDELAPSQELYADLKFLYGKSGVPRKIIQRWVEIVEFETNRQLDRLTNSVFSIRFISKTKTGKDTIDLEIIDNAKGDIRKFKTLSGGERTRINIAITIAMSNSFSDLTGIPIETLWLDEVYGLDEGGQQEFARIIKDVGKEKMIVCATSCFESMSLYFDQVERMEKGKLIR